MVKKKRNQFYITNDIEHEVALANTNYDLVVSLTTYKYRILNSDICNVVDSILKQEFDKKIHIVINVFEDDYQYFSNMQLKFFTDNNIEVLKCKQNLKSHLKYFYAFQKFKESPVVTIDDDCYYDSSLLNDLWNSYQTYPNCISARRCHLMKSNKDNFFLSYKEWPKKVTNIVLPTHELFATGVGGVLYPPNILKIDSSCLDDIYKCINADDIYLKKREYDLNVKVVWCGNNPDSYVNLPIWKQGPALQIENNAFNNDLCIKALGFKPLTNLVRNRQLNVFLRLCDSIDCVNNNDCKGKKREFGNGKVDVILTCLKTVNESIEVAQQHGYDIKLTLVDDKLQQSTIDSINDIVGNDVIWLKPNCNGNVMSFKTCYEQAIKLNDDEFALFLEDDYLCDKNALSEILLFFNMFNDDIWLSPTTDIGNNKIVPVDSSGNRLSTQVFPSSKDGIGIWWKQTNHSTSTFATTVRMLKKYKQKFEDIFKQDYLDQYIRNSIYQIEKCYMPLYPLMQHWQKSKTMYWFDKRNVEREKPYNAVKLAVEDTISNVKKLNVDNYRYDIAKENNNAHVKKDISFNYSLYVDEDLKKSIRYIVFLLLNIKKAITKRVIDDIDIIVHTDEHSLNIFRKFAESEYINLQSIQFKVYRRNTYLRGSSWRYFGIVNLDYKINCICEADDGISSSLAQLDLIKNDNTYAGIFYHAKKYEKSKNAFMGGRFAIRTQMLSDNERYKITQLLNICESTDNIQFNFDEYLLYEIVTHIFKDKRFIVECKENADISVKSWIIEDFEEEKKTLLSKFNKVVVLKVNDYKGKNEQKYSYSNVKLAYLDGESYLFSNTRYSVKYLNHGEKQNDLMHEYMDVLSKLYLDEKHL